MAYSSSSSSFASANMRILGEYCPFIADVPINSYAVSFPIDNPDQRPEEEINKIKNKLRKIINNKSFDPPIPLADFCLVVKERWENSASDDTEYSLGFCNVV